MRALVAKRAYLTHMPRPPTESELAGFRLAALVKRHYTSVFTQLIAGQENYLEAIDASQTNLEDARSLRELAVAFLWVAGTTIGRDAHTRPTLDAMHRAYLTDTEGDAVVFQTHMAEMHYAGNHNYPRLHPAHMGLRYRQYDALTEEDETHEAASLVPLYGAMAGFALPASKHDWLLFASLTSGLHTAIVALRAAIRAMAAAWAC